MSDEEYWTPIHQISWFINSQLQRPIIYASMLVGFPSMLLYCSECWIILRHRQFHNPFYALFVVRSVQDILLLICAYLLFRLPTIMQSPFFFSIYQLSPNSIVVGIFVLYYFGMESGNLATTFMLLNRLTAIIFPFWQEKIWHKLLPIALLVIFGLPMYFCRYFFGMHVGFFLLPDNSFILHENNHDITPIDTDFLGDDSLIVFIVSMTNLVLCTLINIAILIVYNKGRNATAHGRGQKQAGGNGISPAAAVGQDHQNQQQQRTENKLIVYAICTFASHMLFTLLMVGNFLAQIAKDYLTLGGFLSLTPLIIDLGCIVMPSWLLLWASPEFRRQWCRCFMPKWLNKYMGTTSATTRHNNVIHVISSAQRRLNATITISN